MKTDKIILGDGKEYIITEFDVGDFVEIEEKYGSLKLSENKMGPVIFWFWLAIKKAHKDITLERLYKLIPASFITSGGIGKIFESMTKLNNFDDTGDTAKNSESPAEGKKK